MLDVCIMYAKYNIYFLQCYAKSMAKFMFERVLNTTKIYNLIYGVNIRKAKYYTFQRPRTGSLNY